MNAEQELYKKYKAMSESEFDALPDDEWLYFDELDRKYGSSTPSQEVISERGRLDSEEMAREIERQRGEIRREEVANSPFRQTVAPHSSAAVARGEDPSFATGLRDVFSLPLRFVSTGFDEDFSQMQKLPEEHMREGNTLGAVLTHPLTGAGIATAPLAAAATSGLAAATGMSGLPLLAMMGAVGGGAEGAGMGIAHKAMYPEATTGDLAQSMVVPLMSGAVANPAINKLMSPLMRKVTRNLGPSGPARGGVIRNPDVLPWRESPHTVFGVPLETESARLLRQGATNRWTPEGVAEGLKGQLQQELADYTTQRIKPSFSDIGYLEVSPQSKLFAGVDKDLSVQQMAQHLQGRLNLDAGKGAISADDYIRTQKAHRDFVTEIGRLGDSPDLQTVMRSVTRLAEKDPKGAWVVLADIYKLLGGMSTEAPKVVNPPRVVSIMAHNASSSPTPTPQFGPMAIMGVPQTPEAMYQWGLNLASPLSHMGRGAVGATYGANVATNREMDRQDIPFLPRDNP
jgi:hypothetical protein